MKVFVLGGSGEVGRLTAEILAVSDLVSEMVIAGRDLDAAARTAAALGEKATAVHVDLLEEGQLASAAVGSDLIVNTAGPEFKVVIPALREAIRAGVNYCDLCCYAPVTEQALALDDEAKAAGTTALIGIGLVGLTNLMMVHAANQLGRADELRLCLFLSTPIWGYDPTETLAAWRKMGHADASMQILMVQVADKVRLYRDGRWIDVHPLEDTVQVTLPGGDEVTAYPVGLPEPITVPRTLPEVRSVSSLISMFPPEINEACYGFGRRVSDSELDESEGAFAFMQYLEALPESSLALPKGGEEGFAMWVEAVGTKENDRVRYRCWPAYDWLTTKDPLAVAAFKILRGEISAHGVLTPESCLDPIPFFTEVVRTRNAEVSGDELITESFEVLE